MLGKPLVLLLEAAIFLAQALHHQLELGELAAEYKALLFCTYKRIWARFDQAQLSTGDRQCA